MPNPNKQLYFDAHISGLVPVKFIGYKESYGTYYAVMEVCSTVSVYAEGTKLYTRPFEIVYKEKSKGCHIMVSTATLPERNSENTLD